MIFLGLVWSEKELIWKYFDDDKQVIDVKDEQVFITDNHLRFQPYIIFYKKIVKDYSEIGKIFQLIK